MIREVLDWARRADRLVPAEDRRVLFWPPALVLRWSKYALHRALGRPIDRPADDVTARDPELVSIVLELFRGLARVYFRLQVEGISNVRPGPALIVGNHSGGLLPLEGFFTALALHEHFGSGHATFALVHDFIFDDPILRSYAGRLGMLRAGHDSARHAFEVGGSVLVYPGSDFDTFRPFRDRHKVVLGGRKGFVKLALRAGVPIQPVVTAGTHEQLVVLSRGDLLARLLRTHRWMRTDVLPLVIAFPWGLTLGFVPYLPLPAQTTVHFCPPLSYPELGPEAADDPEVVDRIYREVEALMQRELDALGSGRRFLLGKPRPRDP